jgi:hypothetical protein
MTRLVIFGSLVLAILLPSPRERGEGLGARGEPDESRGALPSPPAPLPASGEREEIGQKLPVPANTDLDRATALVTELYGDDFARAKAEPAARLKLAQVLLLEAKATADDAAGRYILLRHAADLAAEAGDPATALEALEQMSLNFELPAAAMLTWKTQALQKAAQATAAPDAYQGIVDSALALVEEAVAVDDFDMALALGLAAESAAKKLKSVPLVSSVRRRLDAVKTLQAEYAHVKPFVEALKKNTKDPTANLQTGKYFAIERGNWDKGLPLLAKGGDQALADVAAAELNNPQSFKQTSALAAKWAKESGRFKGQAQVHVLLRSYHWYQRSFALATSDKERTVIDTAMRAVNEQLPPQQRAGEIAVELRSSIGNEGPVFGVAISADGSRVASGGADGSVRLWDGRTFKQIRRFDGHNGPVWTVQFSPDARHILSGGFDKSLRLWDPVSGRESKRLNGSEDYVRSVAFSDVGPLLLSGGDDRLVRLWDAGTGSELKTLRGHDHYVFGVAVSHDGKRGLSASLDRTVRLWDLETGSVLRVLTGHTDTVLGVAFTPDGRRAISASTDKTVRVWDLSKGQTVNTLKGHAGFVYSVSVSPDGRRALSAGQDGKLILWDVDHGTAVRELHGHVGPVWQVAFSGDGRFAASAGNDGTVRLWGGAK